MTDCKSCDSVEQLRAEKARLESLLASLRADVKLHREFEVRGS